MLYRSCPSPNYKQKGNQELVMRHFLTLHPLHSPRTPHTVSQKNEKKKSFMISRLQALQATIVLGVFGKRFEC